MPIMQFIRRAKNEDFEWIVKKSFDPFNEIYKGKINKKWLEIYLKKCKIYVLKDKSGFIGFVFEPQGILINSWYAEGKGLKLWAFVEKIAKKLKKPLIGFLHKEENKFKKFLIKRKYMISDFNENLYFVEKSEDICHQY